MQSNLVPGMLMWYFVAAVMMTLPASAVVLAAYRRSIARRMRNRSETVDGAAGPLAPPVTGPSPPRAVERSNSARSSRLRRRVVVVYTLAALVTAAMLAAFTFAYNDVQPTPFRVFIFVYVFAWPLVPTLSALLADVRFGTARLTAVYCGLFAAIVLGWSIVSRHVLGDTDVAPLNNLGNAMTVLVATSGVPFLIVLVSGIRKLRPVAPLALAGFLVFSFGALLVQAGFISAVDVGPLRDRLVSLGYLPLFLAAALPVAYVCWLVLRQLGRWHRRKRFSDVQLLVDTWWLIAVFDVCATVATTARWQALWVLLAFVCYRALVAVGLAAWPVSRLRAERGPLLLLRVFGAPNRAERLFDAVTNGWRVHGHVNLIAGADLAARTIDPGKILAFLAGQVRSQFVRDRLDLDRKMAARDEARDPDGRFRINEYFCHDDTWRPTVESLLYDCSFVLMDLRGFSRRNEGCLFEIERLAAGGKLSSTLFVIDDDKSEDLLRATVDQAAATLGVPPDLAAVKIARLGPRTGRDLRGLIAQLASLSASPEGSGWPPVSSGARGGGLAGGPAGHPSGPG